MPRKILGCFVFLGVALVPISCGPATNSSSKPGVPIARGPENADAKASADRPRAKPVPPLQLAVPTAQAERIGEVDFTKKDADSLFILGRAAANRKLYNVAATAQYWYVQKAGTGRYDLACYLSRIGKAHAAFYWLQAAAIEEGVDSEHAQRDEDLEFLRADPRWGKVLRYMQECNRYFASASVTQTLVILPKGYKKDIPIAAVLWMHGLGARPSGFVNEGCQEYADKLNIAIIGVSGTRARGPNSFVWAVDVEEDAKRLRKALVEVSDRVTIKKGFLITFGFSQGAQVGLEVAARYPEEFAGSIALSPGADPHLEKLKPSPLLARRGFVVSCAAGEHPGNVRLTALDAAWLRKARAQVIHKAYPGASEHSFPADFHERFPEWVQFILKVRGE
jgi:predicted esterase